MFGTILLSAITLLHLYVFWRAGSVPLLRRRLSRNRLALAALVLWLLFLIGRFYGHDNDTPPAVLVELAGMIWMATLFLISVPLLAVDLLTGFGAVLPGAAPKLRGAAMLAGIALAAVALVQGARQPVIEDYAVELPGLPPQLDGTVIVGLSDLHLRSVRNGRWLAALADRVRSARPDLIVLLGDLFEGHGRPAQELVDGLKLLQAPHGVWAVLGNHEFHDSDKVMVPLLQEAGIAVLRNEQSEVMPGLVLAGVDDLTVARRWGEREDLVGKALAPASRGATVLLSHTPWHADRAAQAGADLMLCGHTHGGQIWPFGYVVRRFYPLLAGRYHVDGMTVIVSRGAGLWGPPMRLWQPGEIIRVTLRARAKEADVRSRDRGEKGVTPRPTVL